MSSRSRLVLAVILGVALLVASTGIVAAVTVYRAGSILVDVDPKDPAETGVSLRIPAVILPAALALVPDNVFGDDDPQLRAAIPIALKTCEMLETQGDAVLVEVESQRERVRIAKVGGEIRIDVVSNDDEVHVAFPISSVRSVVSRLDRALAASATRA